MPPKKIGVEIVGKFIHIDCYWDQAVVSNIKNMMPKPTTYLKVKGVWKAPLLWESCVAIRQVAQASNHELKIGPLLKVWATAEKVRLASIPDPNSYDMDMREFTGILEADYPEMWAALCSRPFQKVGVRYIATTRAALVADHPGLGKTLQTIAGVVEAGVTGPVLVVAAPKTAATLTWPAELARWVPGEPIIQINGDYKPADREEAVHRIKNYAMQFCNDQPGDGRRVWVVTTPEYIRMKAETDKYGNYVKKSGKKVLLPGAYAQTGLFDIAWSAIIADESHKTLAVGTLNRKKWSAQRIGMELLTMKGDPLKVALSGTPFRGKEENAFGTAHWLLPKKHTSFWRWAENHFVIFSDPSGMGGQEIGELRNEEKFYDWAKEFMIRRTKAEVAKDLPPKVYAGEPLEVATGEAKMPVAPKNLPEEAFADWYQNEIEKLGPVAIWLPIKGQQAKQYKRMAEDAVINFANGETMTVNGVFAENTRFRQLACSAGSLKNETFYPALPSNKFSWCVDFLSDRGLDKDTRPQDMSDIRKIIIASQFTKLLMMFSEELAKLGIETHMLVGGNSKKRPAIQRDWNENDNSTKRVLLGNIAAMGASITLDSLCDDIITLDETWNKEDTEQVEDRIHRLSNTDHSVTVWNLRSLGSYEEGLARRTMDKEDTIKGAIDGARGVEFRRLVLPRD